MSKWGVILALVALIAGALGLGGMTASPIGVAKLLFGVCVAMLVAVLLSALMDSGNRSDRRRR